MEQQIHVLQKEDGLRLPNIQIDIYDSSVMDFSTHLHSQDTKAKSE